MKPLLPVLLAFFLNACGDDPAPVVSGFTLVYSQNVNGEIEPCG